MDTIHTKRGTYLSELQSRDDHQHHAPKAEIQPIPVGQAGIGLSLQEFQQHGQTDGIPPPPLHGYCHQVTWSSATDCHYPGTRREQPSAESVHNHPTRSLPPLDQGS